MNIASLTFETVEIRRYTLRPGQRDTLIDIFERNFIETQESCGMVPIGHYRDLDNPDIFVWFRGYPTFECRAQCLEDFYLRSEAWASNRDAANATMVDSDDVLMLRSAAPDSGFDLRGLERLPLGSASSNTYVAVSIKHLLPQDESALTTAFERDLLDALAKFGSRIAYFVTEPRPNAFPRLPVRENERVFAVIGVCADMNRLRQWTELLAPGGFETMRLQPAQRSLYR